MWPFTKGRHTAGRVPAQRKESELAVEAASRSLEESRQDRAEVDAVSRAVHHALAKNHISQRITILLKDGR